MLIAGWKPARPGPAGSRRSQGRLEACAPREAGGTVRGKLGLEPAGESDDNFSMADEEHLKIMRQGADAWNAWRRLNPEIKPDLTGMSLSGKQAGNLRLAHADLSFATMKKANMRGADIWRAVLNFADMSGANLSRAFFGRSNMYCANLSGADIGFARFIGTDLSGARFSHARIHNSSFIDSDLNGADFSHAWIRATSFANVDLSGVKGLETVRFHGPSSLGIDSIYKSGGSIPTAFLRGCGVPEDFIQQIPTLAYGGPLQNACYICHHALDRVFGEQLHNDLQAQGIRCWLLPEDTDSPLTQATHFEEIAGYHDKLLVVCSKNSLACNAILREINHALYAETAEKRNILVCITRDEHLLKTFTHPRKDDILRKTVSNFQHWEKPESYERALGKVVRALRAMNENQPR